MVDLGSCVANYRNDDRASLIKKLLGHSWIILALIVVSFYALVAICRVSLFFSFLVHVSFWYWMKRRRNEQNNKEPKEVLCWETTQTNFEMEKSDLALYLPTFVCALNIKYSSKQSNQNFDFSFEIKIDFHWIE